MQMNWPFIHPIRTLFTTIIYFSIPFFCWLSSHFIYLPPFYTFFNVSLFLSTARLPLLSCLLTRFLIYWDRQFRSFFCLSLFTDTMTLTPVITPSHLPHKDTDRQMHTYICPNFSPYIPLIPCSLPFPKFYVSFLARFRLAFSNFSDSLYSLLISSYFTYCISTFYLISSYFTYCISTFYLISFYLTYSISTFYLLFS